MVNIIVTRTIVGGFVCANNHKSPSFFLKQSADLVQHYDNPAIADRTHKDGDAKIALERRCRHSRDNVGASGGEEVNLLRCSVKTDPTLSVLLVIDEDDVGTLSDFLLSSQELIDMSGVTGRRVGADNAGEPRNNAVVRWNVLNSLLIACFDTIVVLPVSLPDRDDSKPWRELPGILSENCDHVDHTTSFGKSLCERGPSNNIHANACAKGIFRIDNPDMFAA
ncbi:MAG: hypothetical protein WC683_10575 [bacterium]